MTEIKMTPRNTAAAIRVVADKLAAAFNPPSFLIEDVLMELGFLAACVDTFEKEESDDSNDL